MKILCFGDSNTYGYDPRGFLADRYPRSVCWTDLLENAGHAVRNCGLNGREIPCRPAEIDAAIRLFAAENADLLIVMLGGNDLLMHPYFEAENAAERMEHFLQRIRYILPEQQILLIAPPPMQTGTWVQEHRLLQATQQLPVIYEVLAKKLHISFADSTLWEIPLTFDGVHFTEEGHKRFAAALSSLLKEHYSC